jgi:hypothetical protein
MVTHSASFRRIAWNVLRMAAIAVSTVGCTGTLSYRGTVTEALDCGVSFDAEGNPMDKLPIDAAVVLLPRGSAATCPSRQRVLEIATRIPRGVGGPYYAPVTRTDDRGKFLVAGKTRFGEDDFALLCFYGEGYESQEVRRPIPDPQRLYVNVALCRIAK